MVPIGAPTYDRACACWRLQGRNAWQLKRRVLADRVGTCRLHTGGYLNRFVQMMLHASSPVVYDITSEMGDVDQAMLGCCAACR